MSKLALVSAFLILIILIILIIPGSNDENIDHIFLITIDTLRADHMGCYNYSIDTSPFIDKLAGKGVLFENAFTQSSTTSPSHASIFTGLYPSQHRVLANGYRLDDSFVTLAEILKKNGYKTAAFTSTDRHFLSGNINQGFEKYDEPEDTQNEFGFKYRPARFTIDKSIAWISNFRKEKKMLIWIHLFDPHLPYNPPETHIKKMADPTLKDKLDKITENRAINYEIFNNSKEKYFEEVLKYNAEISYVDSELQRLFKFAEKSGIANNALWIITGDHGEGLGQHNWLGHAKLIYQEQIHVPLIFYSAGHIKPKRVRSVVENSSIFSTVIDICGITMPDEKGNSVLTKSIKDLIFKNGDKSSHEFAFSERQYYGHRIAEKKLPAWQTEWENGKKYSIQNISFKLIYNKGVREPNEFYNLSEDPFELKSEISNRKYFKIKNLLRKELFARLKIFKESKRIKAKKVDSETIKKLKSLGYIN